MTDARRAHWDKVYGSKALSQVSWYEPKPDQSLTRIRDTGVRPRDPIIDVGGGASLLIDELLRAGFRDVTVLDVSAEVLSTLRDRLGERGASVTLLQEDVTAFRPTRRYALWHDRAVFHFLIDRQDRERYLAALRQALLPNGHVIMATFGPAGPDRCSGLPVMRYDASALAVELGAEFQLIDSSLVVHHTPWGAQQQFLYCRFDRIPEALCSKSGALEPGRSG
jgi:2-polyprenyl-3-methyl-5-hydroxy-6-metoxy-1,4-benzoquinol methylase